MTPRIGESREAFLARLRAHESDPVRRARKQAYMRERRQSAEYRARQTAYMKDYRERRRPELLAQAREYMREYSLRPEVQERQRAYAVANKFSAGGVRWNRSTADPELLSIAELIRETKAVLREIREERS